MDADYKKLINILNNPNVPDEIKKIVLFKLYSFYGKNVGEIQEDIEYFNFRSFLFGMIDYKEHQKGVEERKQLADISENYNRILQNTVLLADHFNFDSSIELSILYSYLLWNGYYSANRCHIYDSENRASLSSLYALDVMSGRGVCLNYSDMLTDILNVAGYEAAILVNRATDIKRKAIPYFHINMAPQSVKERLQSLFSFVTPRIIGNHAVVLVKDDEEFYSYDPTNLMPFKIRSKQELSYSPAHAKAFTRMETSYIANFSGRRRILLDEFFLKEGAFRTPEFVYYFEDLIRKRALFLRNNLPTIRDFACDIAPDVNRINMALKNHRKKC